MTISQKELAAELNLSTATVSRSLKDDPGISLKTRSLVLHHAIRRGYQGKSVKNGSGENETAPGVEPGSGNGNGSRMFVVLVQTDEGMPANDNILVPLLGAMSLTAAEKGVSLVFHCVPRAKRNAIDAPENQPEILRSGQVGGVILIHDFHPDSVMRLAQRIPVVSLNIPYPEAGVDCFEPDNFWCMARNVEHLFSLGHRRLAYIDAYYDSTIRGERLGGYAYAAHVAGDPASARRVFRPDSVGADAMAGLEPLIRDEGVTGLVCFNDMVAINALEWLGGQGMVCPRDISVTGFDHIRVPSGLPTLTTCNIPRAEMGRAAVQRLIERQANPHLLPMRFLLNGALVRGESTQAAPSGPRRP